MSDEPKFRKDGQPDGRGHAEGSKATRFGSKDGRRRPGRTPGSKSLKVIYRAAGEMPVKVTVDGRERKITTKEAIVLKQREQALKNGDRAATGFMNKLEEHSPLDVEPDLTATLLAEDEEILASARARGLLAGAPAVALPGSGGKANSPITSGQDEGAQP